MIVVQVTGLSGFVGYNLKSYLVHNNNIKIDEISKDDLSAPKIKPTCFAVVHLAGKAHDIKKTSDPDEYYQVNYEITKKLYVVFYPHC